jgi:hypothetical protein
VPEATRVGRAAEQATIQIVDERLPIGHAVRI